VTVAEYPDTSERTMPKGIAILLEGEGFPWSTLLNIVTAREVFAEFDGNFALTRVTAAKRAVGERRGHLRRPQRANRRSATF